MIPRRYLLIGFGLFLGVLCILAMWGNHKQHQGSDFEHQVTIHEGEANAHVNQAQAIPDHAEAIQRAEARAQAAEADLVGSRAEVDRLRRIVAAERRARVSDPAMPGPSHDQPMEPDHRDELLAADAVLITKLETEVKELKGANLELKTAFTDEQKRSAEYKAAWEAERKRALAQQAATDAWKSAVKTSRWQGRMEGFAVGVAVGYLGSRR